MRSVSGDLSRNMWANGSAGNYIQYRPWLDLPWTLATMLNLTLKQTVTIPVALRSTAQVCRHSIAGIAASNPAEGMSLVFIV
jgi:hypothetical protein